MHGPLGMRLDGASRSSNLSRVGRSRRSGGRCGRRGAIFRFRAVKFLKNHFMRISFADGLREKEKAIPQARRRPRGADQKCCGVGSIGMEILKKPRPGG